MLNSGTIECFTNTLSSRGLIDDDILYPHPQPTRYTKTHYAQHASDRLRTTPLAGYEKTRSWAGDNSSQFSSTRCRR